MDFIAGRSHAFADRWMSAVIMIDFLGTLVVSGRIRSLPVKESQ
jgi:hypothetical protein